MDTQEAKRHLLQIRHIKAEIRGKDDYLRMIRHEMSMLKSPSYDTDQVQSSAPDDKLLNLIMRYSEIEEKLGKEIARLITVRDTIIRQIGELENEKHKQVLYMLYVKGMDWDEMADDMHYTRRRVEQLHGSALQEFAARFIS